MSCPPPRQSPGTSWQPDAAGASHLYRQIGAWRVGTHLQESTAGINDSGPRGGKAVVAPNHGMLNLRRPAGRNGTFGIRTMWSLEPLIGPEGYPLLVLLQPGRHVARADTARRGQPATYTTP